MGVNPTPARQSSPAKQEPSSHSWYHKAALLLYIFFCFEVGTFLLLFPWLDLWDHNYFSHLGPLWNPVWHSPYFRGAVSGLGLLNIWISFSELFRLHRSSAGPERRTDELP